MTSSCIYIFFSTTIYLCNHNMLLVGNCDDLSPILIDIWIKLIQIMTKYPKLEPSKLFVFYRKYLLRDWSSSALCLYYRPLVVHGANIESREMWEALTRDCFSPVILPPKWYHFLFIYGIFKLSLHKHLPLQS